MTEAVRDRTSASDRGAASALVASFFRHLRPVDDALPRVLRRLRIAALAIGLLSTTAFSTSSVADAGPGDGLRLATAAALQAVTGERDGMTFDLDALDAASRAHMALLETVSSGRTGAARAWTGDDGRTSGKTLLASVSRIGQGKSFEDGKDRSGAECAALISAASFSGRGPMVSATLVFCRASGERWELVDAGSNVSTLQELHKKLADALARPDLPRASAEATSQSGMSGIGSSL